MRLVKIIFNEIRQGKNLDVYITLLMAILVTGLGFFQIVDLEIITSAMLAILALVSVSLLVNRHDSGQIQASLRKIDDLEEQLFDLQTSIGIGLTFIPPEADFSPALPQITEIVKGASREILILDYEPFSREEADVQYQDADVISDERREYYRQLIEKVQDDVSGTYRYQRITQIPEDRAISEAIQDDAILREHYQTLVDISKKRPELASLKKCIPLQGLSFLIADRRHLVLEWDVLDPNDRSYSGVGFLILDDPQGEVIQGFLRIFERADAYATLVQESDLG